MTYSTWLRRTGLALTILALAAGGAIAQQYAPQDDPPPKEGPPPPRQDGPAPPGGAEERVRTIIRRYAPGYRLSVSIAPLPRALDEQLGLKGEGVLVTSVAEGGPADKAGIKPHDIVMAAGDKPIKGQGDLLEAVKAADGKELSLKLMRGGKPTTVTVTPEKSEFAWEENVSKFKDNEYVKVLKDEIREKMKDAGVDLRLQFIEPGAFLPKGADFLIDRRADFPDDLNVNIKKEGKKPADIEVKQGDKTWNVKEDKLAELPDEVRRHVEGLLGHGPMRFKVIAPGGVVDLEGPRPPHPPRQPRGPGDDERPRPPRRDGDRAFEGPPEGDFDAPQERTRRRGGLEERLEEMSRHMREMRDELEGLRRRMRDEGFERPRRPDRPEQPDDPEPPQKPQPEDDDK
jgi:hypothetical protein